MVVTLIFIPICYNQRQRGERRLNLRVKLWGLTGINYGIAGGTLCVFVLAIALELEFKLSP
jgi:hypothetical protein